MPVKWLDRKSRWQWHQHRGMKMYMALFVEPLFHLQSSEGNLVNNSKGNDANMNEEVRKLCNEGRLKDALHIFHVMDQRGIRPHAYTYASLLQECINKRSLQDGRLIHDHMTGTGFEPQQFLQTNLVIMYAKCGSLSRARQVFDKMSQRNAVACNAMMTACSKYGRDEEALTLYYQMQQEGIPPDKFTFPAVLPACANLASLKHGKMVHGHILRTGLQSDVFVGSALINLYANCGSIEDAREVFDAMPERDLVSWNAIIAGYAQNGHVTDALNLFEKMSDQNVVSWTGMVAGYSQKGQVDEALRLFHKIPERDVVSWNALVAGYAQKGQVDDALKLFQKMPERDVVSWTTMIAGYSQNGYVDEPLKLFRQMQLTGVKPNLATFPSIIPAYANLAVLKNAKGVHGNIIRTGFQCRISVENALVDMYAKCGSIEDAITVFEAMHERDIVSWNVMIIGYAKHGCAKEALQHFEQMQESGTKPNRITFIGVLSACSHAGLLNDGCQYFHSMNRDYHVTPEAEHYCCMVDLFGRSGHLDEAQDFINKMPIKPNVDLWGSLLGACRIHRNAELGEHVAERIFELDSNNAACYVLLSNIYAGAGRWDDVEKVRKIMKGKKVKKIPGCSWIEVNKNVHSFLVSDRSHPEMDKIYAELERLSRQMKEAGYVPDMNLVLHDVYEGQKENIFCCSDK